MKKFNLILLISILMLGLNLTSLQAQKHKKESKDDNKIEQQVKRSGLLFVKAEERVRGKYGIEIDAGLNKEGKPNIIYRNNKEKELLEDIVSSASIVTVLDLLDRVGYKVEQAYAVQNGDLTTHYFVLKYQDREANDRDGYAVKKKKRNNQNRAQMSPEEIEKRKKMREKK